MDYIYIYISIYQSKYKSDLKEIKMDKNNSNKQKIALCNFERIYKARNNRNGFIF